MQKRVRVRRERPSVLSWALALAVTMLAVYLITLSTPGPSAAEQASAPGARVTVQAQLEGMEMHFAALGCYPSAAQARLAAAELSGRGAAGVVYEQSDGFYVLGAGYVQKTDAERIALRLAEEERLDSAVLTLTAPGVSLRITAREGDAEAVSAADKVVREQLNHIAAMALQVDRGELTAAQVRTLAQVSRSELDKAGAALSQVAGGAEHPVCAGLRAVLEEASGMLDGLARGSEAGASLSGRLRCCHVTGVLRLMAYLKGLSGG